MSDQADNRCLSMRYIGLSDDGKKQYGMVIEVGPNVEVSFTAVNAMLNRSHTAPSGLVEAVKDVLEDAEPIVGYEDEERMVETPLILRLRSAYNSALSSHEPRVCEWGFRKFNSTLDPNIYINCKNEPIVAMYYDLSAKPYCPYCGGVIKVKE